MPADDVRKAVLELRRGKGMVLDAADPDTWSAGSFFTNPIVDSRRLAPVPGRCAALPAAGRLVTKPVAAWLIQHAGFRKGVPVRHACRSRPRSTRSR